MPVRREEAADEAEEEPERAVQHPVRQCNQVGCRIHQIAEADHIENRLGRDRRRTPEFAEPEGLDAEYEECPYEELPAEDQHVSRSARSIMAIIEIGRAHV